MRKSFRCVRKLASDEEGQAAVEYILMLVLAFSLVAVFSGSFRGMVINLWGYYIRQIAAACPGCEAPPYRFR